MLKAAIFSTRDSGDKIFTASKGGSCRGQGPPSSPLPPHVPGGTGWDTGKSQPLFQPAHMGREPREGEAPAAPSLSPFSNAQPLTLQRPTPRNLRPGLNSPLLKVQGAPPLQAGAAGLHSLGPSPASSVMLPYGTPPRPSPEQSGSTHYQALPHVST